MASPVNCLRAPCLLFRVGPPWDYWRAAIIPDDLTNFLAVVALIGRHDDRWPWRLRHRFGARAVIDIAARYHEPERKPSAIDRRVDFRRPAASADPNSLFCPLFCPAGGAMSLLGGTFDHGKRISGMRRVTLKHTLPDPAYGPRVEAITGRRIRAILLRQIVPGNARSEDVENRSDDASIINPCQPPSRGAEWFQGLPFFIRKIVTHANLRGRSNHIYVVISGMSLGTNLS